MASGYRRDEVGEDEPADGDEDYGQCRHGGLEDRGDAVGEQDPQPPSGRDADGYADECPDDGGDRRLRCDQLKSEDIASDARLAK